MAELNFGLLNPPGSQSIGNAFVTGMGQAQEARARDLQMQQSVRQGQMAELQYKKAQDTEAKLNQFYAGVGANGGPKDPVAIEDAMINSGIQQVANTGLAARMTRLGVERDRRLFSEANMPPGAAPGLPTTSTPQPLADGSAPAPTSTNALMGTAPAAPSNALAALVARRDRNIALGTPQGVKNAELIQKDIDNENKRYSVGSSLMTGTGAVVGTAPAAKSSFETLLDRSDLTDPEKMVARRALVGKESTTPPAEYIATIDRLRKTTDPVERQQLLARLTYMSTHTPGTTVNVDTKVGNKYGETFAKEIGDADVKLRGAALDAPTMASNANKTLTLLEDPRIFTGGAANIKLALARALNVIGDTDTTSISNTEKLIQSTGQATLAAIKSSGLGTGQGFTDKDLKMLQGVAGGTIDLNADTLRSFATAQHNAATAIVNRWETRRKGIPSAALTGTGIDKETYPIEPKFSRYVEEKTVNGRRLGKKADGTVEEIR